MANINFGILDTQSPAKIGNAFIRTPEQQNANMLQAMQMQGFVNQNELAQSQLRTARRAEEGQALLGQAYAGTDFGTGGTAGGMAGGAGQSPYSLMKLSVVKKLLGTPSAYLIPSELAKLTEMEHKETTNREAQGKVEKQAREAIDYTLKQYQAEVPRVTDAAGVERYTRATFRDKFLGPIVSRFKTEDQAVADAVNLFNSPGGANKWATQNMGMSADKLVDMLKTTTRTTNLGNVSREVKVDAFGNAVGVPVDTPMGAAPSTAAALLSANAASMKWDPEQLRFVNVVPAGTAMQPPAASNASVAAPTNAMGTSPAAPVNAMIARPAAQAAAPAAAAPAATGGYSNRVLREMAVKGMQPDGKGGQTFISGGEKDPAVIVRLETAKAEGAATGKDMVAAVRTLPNAIASSQKALANIDAMLGDSRVVGDKIVFSKGKGPHPGFENAVGAGIGLRFIPGTSASDFQERFREVTSGAFLEAFESLRGGGAITEKEGEKATAAKTRMSLAQSEKEFVTAAREYQNIIRVGIGRAQERLAKAQAGSASNTSGGTPAVNIDALLKKYE